MAGLVMKAVITLTWENGMKTKLGSIGIEEQKEGMKLKNHAKRMNQAFGWALVRLGFKMMLPKCVWIFDREDD